MTTDKTVQLFGYESEEPPTEWYHSRYSDWIESYDDVHTIEQESQESDIAPYEDAEICQQQDKFRQPSKDSLKIS